MIWLVNKFLTKSIPGVSIDEISFIVRIFDPLHEDENTVILHFSLK